MGASFGARRALERNGLTRGDHASVVPGHVQATPVRRANDRPPPGFRKHERRWRDASFFLVERRRGKLYMYGSIGFAAGLWTYIYLFVRFH